MADLRRQLSGWLADALASAYPEARDLATTLERPRDAAHGDFASNAAMVAARALKRNPREIATRIVAALAPSELVAKAEVAGAGFINVTLAPAARQAVVARVLAEGDAFGRSDARRGERVMVEFVSANPTGPLHVGHGRQAVLGDAIAALFAAEGADVTREFYYNDAGAQIDNLARSVRARIREREGVAEPFPEDGYRGDYIRELAVRYVDEKGDPDDMDALRRFAVAALRAEQDVDLRAIGVVFDNFYLESSLYTDGRVERTVAALVASGHTFEEGGALWLRTTAFGDDKDRVMRKSDGSFTYFVPDVAYHVAKFERGFRHVVNVQGSDHHSTVTRVRAGLQALGLGIPQGYPDYVLHKMVRVVKGGEEVKISKRAGSYVTLRDLIDEAGRDAVRYFLVSRKADSEFTFDIDLARAKSDENPVYYVQYAHARMASVLRQAGIAFHDAAASVAGADLALLTSSYEIALMRRLDEFPDEVALSARELAPHRLTSWLKELSQEFHSYYNAERFLVDDPALARARLALCVATGQVIRSGLALLGIGAPLEM
ncbi:MAG TPA: arginine--tRNA ligase [Casimicrobiaceae bacterium]|nr:arginine--tRNA ligase [Casimicrobiaceae bacterium]